HLHVEGAVIALRRRLVARLLLEELDGDRIADAHPRRVIHGVEHRLLHVRLARFGATGGAAAEQTERQHHPCDQSLVPAHGRPLAGLAVAEENPAERRLSASLIRAVQALGPDLYGHLRRSRGGMTAGARPHINEAGAPVPAYCFTSETKTTSWRADRVS